MKFEIEKGVPAPDKSKYPFKSMEIGDSFYVERISTSSLYQSAMSWRRRAGLRWVFATKDELNGARIWRIK